MISAALDLSFTSTGVAVVNFDELTLMTTAVKVGCGDKTFERMQHSITTILDTLTAVFESHHVDSVVMEQPFCGACFSAGLYGLDSAVYQAFRDKVVKTYHPSTLRRIHGRKYTKKDSISLGQKLIISMINKGFTVINPHNKITSDEAEALIYNIYYHHPEWIK